VNASTNEPGKKGCSKRFCRWFDQGTSPRGVALGFGVGMSVGPDVGVGVGVNSGEVVSVATGASEVGVKVRAGLGVGLMYSSPSRLTRCSSAMARNSGLVSSILRTFCQFAIASGRIGGFVDSKT
jgi:hypothetical protein